MTTAPLADKFLQVGVVIVRRYPVGVDIAQDGADLELLLADFVEVLLRHGRVDMLGEPERPVADRLRRDEALAMVAMVAGKLRDDAVGSLLGHVDRALPGPIGDVDLVADLGEGGAHRFRRRAAPGPE